MQHHVALLSRLATSGFLLWERSLSSSIITSILIQPQKITLIYFALPLLRRAQRKGKDDTIGHGESLSRASDAVLSETASFMMIQLLKSTICCSLAHEDTKTNINP